MPADDDLRVLLFQIVRELLFSVVKHAGVTEAVVALAVDAGRLRIEVSGKGQGLAEARTDTATSTVREPR